MAVVAGEEAAERFARVLSSWLGTDAVMRYPDIREMPWSDSNSDVALIGKRCQAMYRIASDKPCIVVASARSLLRRVPPLGSDYYIPVTYGVGDQLESIDMVVQKLVELAYQDAGEPSAVNEPGTFHRHGDTVDVYPAQATSPIRIEFFGDEVDRIRSVVPSTGQTIRELDSVAIGPCREYILSDDNVRRARRALADLAGEESRIANDLSHIRQKIAAPGIEQYMRHLHGSTTSPLKHLPKDALVVLAEPRALIDECSHAFDEIIVSASNAGRSRSGLFTEPQKLDFGSQQRLSFSSIMRTGTGTPKAELPTSQPNVAGSDTKLLGKLRELVRDRYAVLFAVPDRSARHHLERHLSDENIPFCERLEPQPQGDSTAWDTATTMNDKGAPESTEPGTMLRRSQASPLDRGIVTFSDVPVPSGTIVPSAKLAIISVSDLTARMAKRSRSARRVDLTSVTFPFKPGDYVVHATHGIALFKSIVKQTTSGLSRDYFLLEYAQGDKLFVPLEQVDRITRYVGPNSDKPRLTRLNSADWTRSIGKARKSAKKLAFDLVDLYTRRASIKGHPCSPDTPAQRDLEVSFTHELTPDQEHALADIKADMESPRPMDRLLCGDVGFGKTEVALRAAFKACQDDRQVMILCPTTILAQQHFETFHARFTPFALDVRILSRFVSPGDQKRTIEAFARGEADVLIGTHRLLSSDVNPHDLGLIIVDEEQRFGVQHKEQLKNLREQVDVLTLSATPIPRTMQMAVSGVRDMSLIMTPPPGRRPVKVSIGEYDSDTVSAAIRNELARGGQVYYVSNRVRSLDDAVERVKEAVPEARIAVAHGQMSAKAVEEVMLEFVEHECDVLVATTIIESGIDNPHTNTLIIEDSERLGLAQLYQLKGRVGRSHEQAYAYFMFPPEKPLTQEAIDRLTALHEYQALGSGMKVAMRDLEIRGAGSLMGAEQHGNLSSVGFDLFTQMLGEAVAEARGETAELDSTEVAVNVPGDFYLAEDYLPEVDKRVLTYRKLATASELEQVDNLQRSIETEHGTMPSAARNLLNRVRIRIRAGRLGCTSVALAKGRLVFSDIKVPRSVANQMKEQRAVYLVQSKRLTYPCQTSKAVSPIELALKVLEEIGGGDED